MTREALLAAMFDGPWPAVRREEGFRDARLGKPKLSRDPDYLAGYAMGDRDASRARARTEDRSARGTTP